jgi:hypothetical protein
MRDCVKLMDCLNACPPPRQESCLDACAGGAGASAPGYTEFNAIATCSEGPAYKAPPGAICGYP